MSTDSGAKWRSEYVDNALFYTAKDIDKLIQDTEDTFINQLEGGDRKKAATEGIGGAPDEQIRRVPKRWGCAAPRVSVDAPGLRRGDRQL